jgi:hypothetical protein
MKLQGAGSLKEEDQEEAISSTQTPVPGTLRNHFFSS